MLELNDGLVSAAPMLRPTSAGNPTMSETTGRVGTSFYISPGELRPAWMPYVRPQDARPVHVTHE